jgi:hypothetical protein
VAVGRAAGYKRRNLRGTGQTSKGMVNQDDDEDFPATKKTIRKDNEDFTRPKVADDEGRKQPLLCYLPTSSGPRRTGKSFRKATNCRRKLGIKVTLAAMDNMVKLLLTVK